MTGESGPPPVEVAVGVVIRGDGAVLLGQRVAGKPYAGWWEFPGGKLEPGESVEQALARELHEELGLDVDASLPWVVREFVYPHAHVRLHFRRVRGFRGEPHSREGQAFVWRHPDAIDVAPLLPATVPVIGWLRLPSLCVRCGFAALAEGPGLQALAAALARGGHRAPMVLLEEPSLPPARFESLFYQVKALCARRRAPLLVGDAHPASFAAAADGTVVPVARLAARCARPARALVAARCGSAADLALAARCGADFALVGGAGAGLLADGAPLPAMLEGDDTSGEAGARIAAAQRSGAHGIALALRFWQHTASGA